MTAFLALLPCLVVIAAVLWFRQTGLMAAVTALGLTILLWLAGTFSPLELLSLPRAAVDGLLLCLLVVGALRCVITMLTAAAD